MKFKQLSSDLPYTQPTRATAHSAGYDLYASESSVLYGGSVRVVGTNTTLTDMENTHVAMVCPRSGLAAKSHITILNAPGVVDADYTGEIKVILHNAGQNTVAINAGDKIAQIVFVRFEKVTDDAGSDVSRGAGGFGSTGK